ncbi:MAG: Flp family type IVb pilin [Nocardioides sp.]
MFDKLMHLAIMLKNREERGATATEYALLVALIAFAIIIGVGLFGENLNTFFEEIAATVGGWNTAG